jgi:hypothetical protein
MALHNDVGNKLNAVMQDNMVTYDAVRSDFYVITRAVA